MDEKRLQIIEKRIAMARIVPNDINDLVTALRETRKEQNEARQSIKDAAAVLGCAPSDLVAMCKETVNDKRKLEREAQTLSDLITGCGFEVYQDGDRVGLRNESLHIIYFQEDES